MIYGFTTKQCIYIIILFMTFTGGVYITIKEKKPFFLMFLMIIILLLYFKFNQSYLLIKTLNYIIGPSVIIGLVTGLLNLKDPVDPIWDVHFLTDKGMKVIKNIKRGVLILGAAGSGKTDSPIYCIMKHFAKSNFGGIIYDYKDGELSEIAKPLFGQRLKIIAVHKPYIGLRINPLSNRYITGETDINEVVKVIMANLSAGGKADFFTENAEALLVAIILKFHLHHNEYCTFPHIIAFILASDFGEDAESASLSDQAEAKFLKLKKFLTSDQRVQMQGSSFIMGLGSERQTAAVLSTLANSLRKLATPEIFYVLSSDDVRLDVNSKDNDSVICVINQPKIDTFLSPVIATIIHTATKQMMERDRKQSFLLLDEAPTIKLPNMAKIPATMRSFGVTTIYCMQDLSQGIMQYGRDGIKEITANLSVQYFGKTNDTETSKYYEGFFEMIKVKTLSKSYKGGGGFFGSMSGTNVGEREISKVRAIEFFKLKPGQFAFISDGEGEIVKFSRQNIIREKLDDSKLKTNEEYKRTFDEIIRVANEIINK
jgi:Type IV secretory system Conjugative DNA transfer